MSEFRPGSTAARLRCNSPPMAHLFDQVVLVTGCSSGIGRALAQAFDDAGHRTFATARNLESISNLRGKRIEPLPLDVTNEASVNNAVRAVAERAGRIDIVVNNAGYILVGPLAELPLDEFRAVFETNVVGALSVVRAAFPHMADRRAGRVVNVGSVVGEIPTPFAGAYCASKSALHMLNEVLRMELVPFGIDVILVEPARVRSSIANAAARGVERYEEESSRYRRVYSNIRARAAASQEGPMDADRFARRMVEAVTQSNPPRVLRLGHGARTISLLNRLPRSILDRALMRRFGVNGLFDQNQG
jgi:NAD(P)-dependent dehydrogenase (short-subunit alcohol dehydrogenase family)